MSFKASLQKSESEIRSVEQVHSPKFSIILPVYNVENYLVECLDSLINQTLSDLEFICINDGSTDNSLEILNLYAAQDKRFIVVTQENQGQGVAKNNVLKMAKGEYIVFVDPDDWIELDAMEVLYNTFKSTQTDVIQFNYTRYIENTGNLKKINVAQHILEKFGLDLNANPNFNWKKVKKGCLHDVDMHVVAKAYSRNLIEKSGAVFSPTRHGEDHLFAHIIILNAENIYYLDRYLYTYRIRQGSSVHKLSNDNFCIFQNFEHSKEYLESMNLYEELKDPFKLYLIQAMAWHYNGIPHESIKKYETLCRTYLTPTEFKKMHILVKGKYSFWELLFSVKNQHLLGIRYKIVTLFGIKLKIKQT